MPPAVGMAPFAVPAPVRLTTGLSDPPKIEAEKDAYDKALAAQLDKQVKAVEEEARIKKAILHWLHIDYPRRLAARQRRLPRYSEVLMLAGRRARSCRR